VASFRRIHRRISMLHFACNLHGDADLDQFAFTNSRTPPPFLDPSRPALHQLRPIWIDPALHRLDWMNRAALLGQEMTLTIWRLAQAQHSRIADHIFGFECVTANAEVIGSPAEVVLGKVYKATHLATFCAARLTAETHVVPILTSFRRTAGRCCSARDLSLQLLAQSPAIGTAVIRTPGGEVMLFEIELVSEIDIRFAVEEITQIQPWALQVDRVDLEIAPVQRAVRVVMIDLAFTLRVLDALDGKSCPASRTEFSASILLVRGKGMQLVRSRFKRLRRFGSAADDQRGLEVDPERDLEAESVPGVNDHDQVNEQHSSHER